MATTRTSSTKVVTSDCARGLVVVNVMECEVDVAVNCEDMKGCQNHTVFDE